MRIHRKLRGSSSCAILCAIVAILGACSFQINCKTFIIISYNLYYLCKGFRLETRGYMIALYVHLILDPWETFVSLVIYKYNTFLCFDRSRSAFQSNLQTHLSYIGKEESSNLLKAIRLIGKLYFVNPFVPNLIVIEGNYNVKVAGRKVTINETWKIFASIMCTPRKGERALWYKLEIDCPFFHFPLFDL